MLDQKAGLYQDKISMHVLPYLLAQLFHATINIEKMTNISETVIDDLV